MKMKLKSKEDRILKAFRRFDLNHDGELDSNEMRQALESIGISVNDDELEQMMLEADTDMNSQLSYKEFNNVIGETNALLGTGIENKHWALVCEAMFKGSLTPEMTPASPTDHPFKKMESTQDLENYLNNQDDDGGSVDIDALINEGKDDAKDDNASLDLDGLLDDNKSETKADNEGKNEDNASLDLDGLLNDNKSESNVKRENDDNASLDLDGLLDDTKSVDNENGNAEKNDNAENNDNVSLDLDNLLDDSHSSNEDSKTKEESNNQDKGSNHFNVEESKDDSNEGSSEPKGKETKIKEDANESDQSNSDSDDFDMEKMLNNAKSKLSDSDDGSLDMEALINGMKSPKRDGNETDPKEAKNMGNSDNLLKKRFSRKDLEPLKVTREESKHTIETNISDTDSLKSNHSKSSSVVSLIVSNSHEKDPKVSQYINEKLNNEAKRANGKAEKRKSPTKRLSPSKSASSNPSRSPLRKKMEFINDPMRFDSKPKVPTRFVTQSLPKRPSTSVPVSSKPFLPSGLPKFRPQTSGLDIPRAISQNERSKPGVPRFTFVKRSDEKPYYKKKEYIKGYLNTRPKKLPEKPKTPKSRCRLQKLTDEMKEQRKLLFKRLKKKKEEQDTLEQEKSELEEKEQKMRTSPTKYHINNIQRRKNRSHRKVRNIQWVCIPKWHFPPKMHNHNCVNVKDKYLVLLGHTDQVHSMYIFKDKRWFALKTTFKPEDGHSVIYHPDLNELFLYGGMQDGLEHQKLKNYERNYDELTNRVRQLEIEEKVVQDDIQQELNELNSVRDEIIELKRQLLKINEDIQKCYDENTKLRDQFNTMEEDKDEFINQKEKQIHEKMKDYNDFQYAVIQQEETLRNLIEEKRKAHAMQISRLLNLQEERATIEANLLNKVMKGDDHISERNRSTDFHTTLLTDKDSIASSDVSTELNGTRLNPDENPQLYIQSLTLQIQESNSRAKSLKSQERELTKQLEDLEKEVSLRHVNLVTYTSMYEKEKDEFMKKYTANRNRILEKIEEHQAALQTSKESANISSLIRSKESSTKKIQEKIDSKTLQISIKKQNIEDCWKQLKTEHDALRTLQLEKSLNSNALWGFNLKDKEWKRIDEAGQQDIFATQFHSAVYSSKLNAMLVYGGVRNQKLSDALRILSFDKYEWKVLKDLQGPGQRYHHTSSTCDNKMYLFGGMDESEMYNDFWECDLSSFQWKLVETQGTQPEPCAHPSSYIHNSMFYLWSHDSLYVLNLKTFVWTKYYDSAIYPRTGASLCPLMTHLVLFGGKLESGSTCNDMYDFNPKPKPQQTHNRTQSPKRVKDWRRYSNHYRPDEAKYHQLKLFPQLHAHSSSYTRPLYNSRKVYQAEPSPFLHTL